MVNFQDIAVFILATTRTNGRYKQDYPTYFESRIVPIRETWGQLFPSLYFVFGANKADYNFLNQQCRSNENNRKLLSRDKTIPLQNVVTPYTCPIYEVESHYKTGDSNDKSKLQSQALLYEFNALWTGNCTGEYFGYGPTCRCQESMRYFYTDPSFKSKEWFIFMDDDIYFRPYALQSMLSTLSSNKAIKVDGPLAVVSASKYRAFQFSKRGPSNSTDEEHSCRNSNVYDFPLAQPAIMNRYSIVYTMYTVVRYSYYTVY